MIISVSKEELVSLLLRDIKAWETVGGGPNLSAFEFDPKNVDANLLEQFGYYKNREAWVAGVQIKKIRQYIQELEEQQVRD